MKHKYGIALMVALALAGCGRNSSDGQADVTIPDHSRLGEQGRAIIIGIDVTASCESIRKRAFIEARNIAHKCEPGDYLHVRLITDKSQLASNTILSCSFPTVQDNINMFDISAKKKYASAAKRFTQLKHQVLNVLDTLMAGPARQTDLIGFVSVAASILKTESNTRRMEIHVISDFMENVGFNSDCDLSHVHLVMHTNTLEADPKRSSLWYEKFASYATKCGSESTTIIPVQ